MAFIYSYILVLIAASFNALMDNLENQVAFNASIFKNWDKKFWCKEISWQYAKKIFGYKIDGWHLAKSMMICCLIGAIIIFKPWHQWWVHFISLGIIWNGSFDLFYKVFKSK
jgi:hypothetical protein